MEETIMLEELIPPVEKKKRTRKPKIIPPFSIQKKGGTIKNISFYTNNYVYNNQINTGDLVMSPYTPLIPFNYLFLDQFGIGDVPISSLYYYIKRADANPLLKKKIEAKTFSSPIDYFAYYKLQETRGKQDVIRYIKEVANSYITEDRQLLAKNTYNSWTGSRIDWWSKAFIEKGRIGQYNTRTYSGWIGNLSLFLKGGHNVYTPHILAVIRPEDLIAAKYEYLLTGAVGLDRMVLLVDRELDSTSFHNVNFRAMYKKYIEPMINNLDVNVIKVPVSYILENCFQQPFKLSSRNIFERKKEIEELAKTFIASIGGIVGARIGDEGDEFGDEDDNYEEENDEEPISDTAIPFPLSEGSTGDSIAPIGEYRFVDTDRFTWTVPPQETPTYTITSGADPYRMDSVTPPISNGITARDYHMYTSREGINYINRAVDEMADRMEINMNRTQENAVFDERVLNSRIAELERQQPEHSVVEDVRVMVEGFGENDPF